jgi:hypothetical protein
MTIAAASREPFSVELEADEQGVLWSWTRSAPGINRRRVSGRVAPRPCVARGAGAARRAWIQSRRIQ